MESIMDIPQVPLQHNIIILRCLSQTLQAHSRGLKALGVSKGSYCTMISPILLRGFPREMSIEYYRKMTSREAGSATGSRTSASEASAVPAIDHTHLRALQALLKFLCIQVKNRENATNEILKDVAGTPMRHFTKHGTQKNPTDHCKQQSLTLAAVHGRADDHDCLFCKSKENGTSDCYSKIALAGKSAGWRTPIGVLVHEREPYCKDLSKCTLLPQVPRQANVHQV